VSHQPAPGASAFCITVFGTTQSTELLLFLEVSPLLLR